MVPVPEEYHDAVVEFVRRRRVLSAAPPVEPRSVDDAVGRLDGQARRLLAAAAEAVLAARPLTVAGAAQALGWSTQEVLGTILELNHAAGPVGSAGFLVQLRRSEDDGGPGGLHAQVVGLDEEIATAVLAR
jgi:hypothetical protein